MKRFVAIVAGLAALVAGALAVSAAGIEEGTRYRIIFDNASGLVEQADFRVGGVAVGQIDSFEIAPGARAAVTVSVSDTGFGGLREDTRCAIQQQSLIGEYFVQCEPGQSGEVLQDGATVPVEQTESPIAPDLVQNIMRRPFRERFSIIFSELGAGFAARGDDVNETIRRALPALQETNRVLKILGDNRKTLRRLAADSGVILKELGDRRRDVGRFVEEARDTAVATAERRDALAATFRQFPGFLDEFTPTMADLGTTARELGPALADLSAAAPATERLLETLPPFARASEVAVDSLGEAGKAGREAAAAAGPTLDELAQLGENATEPANNLAIILEHLDDRDFAAEPDSDSPGGKGYTGLEAILQYPFDQSLALNIFDTRGYTLKLNVLINDCAAYTTDEDAKEDPERYETCSQALGPNQPGITTPDPTEGSAATERTTRKAKQRKAKRDKAGDGEQEPERTGSDGDATPKPTPTPRPTVPNLPELLDRLPDVLGGKRPVQRPAPSKRPPVDLLDFLLAP